LGGISKNAARALIEMAKGAGIIIEKDATYGEASITRLGLKGRFHDIDRKYARIREQVWEGRAKISPKMSDKEYEDLWDDFGDGGNYHFLAIPVLRVEAGRKYKKSEYREAAMAFMAVAALLDPTLDQDYPEPESEPEPKAVAMPEAKPKAKPRTKSKKEIKADKKAAVEKILRLLDGDDIAEVGFDAQAKVDGITPEAGKLLLLSWAKSAGLGKGDKTVIPTAAQLKPKFIVNTVAENDSVMADVIKQCGLENTGQAKELAEKFFKFALIHLDIIDGPKVDDPEEMVKTAKADAEVLGPKGDLPGEDEDVIPVND
jgi:hypothetical protein